MPCPSKLSVTFGSKLKRGQWFLVLLISLPIMEAECEKVSESGKRGESRNWEVTLRTLAGLL